MFDIRTRNQFPDDAVRRKFGNKKRFQETLRFNYILTMSNTRIKKLLSILLKGTNMANKAPHIQYHLKTAKNWNPPL